LFEKQAGGNLHCVREGAGVIQTKRLELMRLMEEGRRGKPGPSNGEEHAGRVSTEKELKKEILFYPRAGYKKRSKKRNDFRKKERK